MQKIYDSNMQKCNVMQICKSGDSGGMMVAGAREQILIKICNEGEGGGVEGWWWIRWWSLEDKFWSKYAMRVMVVVLRVVTKVVMIFSGQILIQIYKLGDGCVE